MPSYIYIHHFTGIFHFTLIIALIKRQDDIHLKPRFRQDRRQFPDYIPHPTGLEYGSTLRSDKHYHPHIHPTQDLRGYRSRDLVVAVLHQTGEHMLNLFLFRGMFLSHIVNNHSKVRGNQRLYPGPSFHKMRQLRKPLLKDGITLA